MVHYNNQAQGWGLRTNTSSSAVSMAQLLPLLHAKLDAPTRLVHLKALPCWQNQSINLVPVADVVLSTVPAYAENLVQIEAAANGDV